MDCVIEVGHDVCWCMHEGMLPAITELILGLCFGIINLGLYIFWNLHNCKEHLDTCIRLGASSGLEIFFQTNLSCRASAPKNSLVLTKNLLALLFRSENEKKLKMNHCFIDTEAKHVNEYG